MIRFDFKDEALIYQVRKDRYGNDVPQAPASVQALYEQTTGFEHGNNQDATTAASRLYLPGDDAFIVSNAQRLEGMVVQVNPFGDAANQQLFRIARVTPIRDILLGNDLQHVECDLEKISEFSYVS